MGLASSVPVGRWVAVESRIPDFANAILTWLAVAYTLISGHWAVWLAIGRRARLITDYALSGNKAG
jgi:hypothetical protein